MIYASLYTICCKVSLDKVMDYGKFWHAIFMILPVHHEMDCAKVLWADLYMDLYDTQQASKWGMTLRWWCALHNGTRELAQGWPR